MSCVTWLGFRNVGPPHFCQILRWTGFAPIMVSRAVAKQGSVAGVLVLDFFLGGIVLLVREAF